MTSDKYFGFEAMLGTGKIHYGKAKNKKITMING